MKQLLRYSLGLVLLMTLPAHGGIVVNEVMAYTPPDSTGLEWVELYKDDTVTVNLGAYSISITSHDGSSAGHALSGTVAADPYIILCRNRPVYDVRWGNASGIWGDSPVEDYPVFEVSFVLTDSSGSAALLRVGSEQSRLTWSQPGLRSHSWERAHPNSDRIEQSIDPYGSTPGRENSVAALSSDLALEGVEVSSENGLTNLSYTIVNRGLDPVNDDTVHLHYYDINATDSLGALIASEAIGPVDTGYTIILIGQYSLPGVYLDLVAQLNDDDRNANNRFVFTGVGREYPPVILTEFLANPETGSNTEWVEIKNRSTQPIHLLNWQLGDSLDLTVISETELILEPQHYLVLAWSSQDFLDYYTGFAYDLTQPGSWPRLNNTSDVVRLFDVLGLEADEFHYTDVFEDNHTWARAETGERAGEWGRSQDSGGTPGEINRVQFSADGNVGLAIDIQPRIISPDGDGRDDEAVITLSRPEASAYTLKIYDKVGRLVKTFEDDLASSHFNDEYTWDGTNNSHERLPIGIYVVYFEASGVESVKTTVVIAR